MNDVEKIIDYNFEGQRLFFENSKRIDDERFTDHISISNYASNAVYAMKTMGVINGYENGEFIPTGNLTRAEAVKVISLVIKMK